MTEARMPAVFAAVIVIGHAHGRCGGDYHGVKVRDP